MIRLACLILAALFLGACATKPMAERDPASEFMVNLATHCGQAYAGRLVSSDPQDADFVGEAMVMHVRSCAEDEIRVPFHVSEDRSRTWVISRTDGGLRLKHDHRHEDGEEDVITQYGGDALVFDTAERIAFPVDAYSIDLFNREGLTASITNIWALELTETVFAYELRRSSRYFRVEFDLTQPVTPPPAPWGAAG
ncbi:MAG: hypothetical protein AAGI03_09980 [Pseudomonadota bacterium]